MKSEKCNIDKIDGEDFVYQCFSFSPEIQDDTFIGKEFIGLNRDYELEPMEIFERLMEAGPEGILPDLLKELEELIGEGNYIYDGNEIGNDEFNLYFFIRASEYKSILNKIEKWKEYKEFGNKMWWYEKDI
ncbi:MAG: hypothetical protein KJ799_03885 [Bacteroidetes bacterium]|nr:hypothetical protein [Bacteroidota bacterium]MBU1680683.1 hypothetical protein [Bacteroidota bacterium]MBU2505848.1 hypothetical protein [Bacteroidota bacterium]